MGKSVYELVQFKFKEAWYALSQDERDELWAKVMELNEKAGAKVVISCHSTWSSNRWQWFMVKEYPSIETLQQHYADLDQIDWYRYGEAETSLGIKAGEESAGT